MSTSIQYLSSIDPLVSHRAGLAQPATRRMRGSRGRRSPGRIARGRC